MAVTSVVDRNTLQYQNELFEQIIPGANSRSLSPVTATDRGWGGGGGWPGTATARLGLATCSPFGAQFVLGWAGPRWHARVGPQLGAIMNLYRQ